MAKRTGGRDARSRADDEYVPYQKAPTPRQLARKRKRAQQAMPSPSLAGTPEPVTIAPDHTTATSTADRRAGANRVEAEIIVEVTIERIVPGGAGLAHAQDRTIFIPLTAPGDHVRARIERTRGKVAFGRAIELLEPGPDRIAPPHPDFSECGGADFQHLTYPAQLMAKVAIVRDCLRRIAGIETPETVAITPSPRQWGYRSRTEWRFDAEQLRLGYVRRESHHVCDVTDDPFAVPELNALLREVRVFLESGSLPLDAAEFRAAAADNDVGLSPALVPAHAAELQRTVLGERYRFDADCFFQANHDLLPALVTEALIHAPSVDAPSRDGLAIDLFCGVGLFTLPLARRFGRVVGVESFPTSAVYARRNLAAAGLKDARIEAARVDRWLDLRAKAMAPAEFVLLDPPRVGVSEGVLAGIHQLRPTRITYVSCDPATLARDLRLLLAGGYRLDGIAAFDLFPQTHHVEVVAHLAREGNGELPSDFQVSSSPRGFHL